MLREQLLAGRNIALSGGGGALELAMSRLGAGVELLSGGDDAAIEEWARSRAPIHALVYDASAHPASLAGALEPAWTAIRAVAAAALIPRGEGGKVLLIGPRPQAVAHAEAVRSALENTARTLSVEWARYSITTTMIAPGLTITDEELHTLVCFLLSRAGDYFSGCRFELH